MEIGAKRAYLAAVQERYKKSSKKQKTQILNEYCSNCNYNRKHAIKLLSRKSGPQSYSKRVGGYCIEEGKRNQQGTRVPHSFKVIVFGKRIYYLEPQGETPRFVELPPIYSGSTWEKQLELTSRRCTNLYLSKIHLKDFRISCP